MNRTTRLLLLSILLSSSSSAQAAVILGGSAMVQFDKIELLTQATLQPVWFYGPTDGAKTATKDQVNAVFFGGGFQGGGAALADAPSYALPHEINVGSVSSPTGRTRQTTNLDIDLSAPAPLSSWALGEQIGLDGITTFSSTFGGGIASGDYALVFSSALNRLSLRNNFDFSIEAFRIDNPTLTLTANGFTLDGDLLTGDFFPANGLTAGLDVGHFTLNGVTAVPEPSSFAILGLSGFALGLYRRRRRSASLALFDQR